jgi:hypothetical protein
MDSSLVVTAMDQTPMNKLMHNNLYNCASLSPPPPLPALVINHTLNAQEQIKLALTQLTTMLVEEYQYWNQQPLIIKTDIVHTIQKMHYTLTALQELNACTPHRTKDLVFMCHQNFNELFELRHCFCAPKSSPARHKEAIDLLSTILVTINNQPF